MATRLIADVGGTNTRLALFDEPTGEFRQVRNYTNGEYRSLAAVIETWRDQLDEAWPEAASIAAAAPPSDGVVTMVNIGWSFSAQSLAGDFGFQNVRTLNDFQANAHALPYLEDKDLAQIHPGAGGGNSKLATVGPGTGLGGATLQWVGGVPIALDAEPGHVGLSPGTELESAIFSHLLPDHHDIYAELLVSGAGLARLYQTVAALQGVAPEALAPADVSSRGLAGSDPLCVQALETFCALLGSACGDFLLSNGAYGGLYIAGGIAPRMVTFLRDSTFLDRLQGKGAMREHLARIPVFVITEEYPGLIGAAHAPLQD
jgi:glucokinase